MASDKVYQACTFECKRVLRAGGYLEVSVLDLDMMNMGVNVRKALRSLKTDIYTSDSQASLKNMGDVMMTLIGRRGFGNVQRCVVGVPAAGRIPRSQDFSSGNSSGRSSTQTTSSETQDGRLPPGKKSDFSDLLYGPTASGSSRDGKANDEGITKMVAKVGRWWYSTCYESITPAATSIWDRPGVLRECEKQGTSFKLLLCYAQKPTCAPRRTVSV